MSTRMLNPEIEQYLIFDEEGGAIGIRADAPEDLKKEWEEYTKIEYDENGMAISS